MCETELLPMGIADFEALRQDGCVYIDKTDMISSFASKRNTCFLSRPRRFGKSLLSSTLHSLFEHGLEYFQGLKIEKLWHDKTYPVIHLNFAMFQRENFAAFNAAFCDRLQFIAHTYNLSGVENITDSTTLLTRIVAHIRLSGETPVLIVDEYDAQLTQFLDNAEEFNKVLVSLNNFYSTVKALTWRFVFITGVTRYSHTSIFSAFNNIVDLSFRADCADLLGITAAELRQYFPVHLTKAAQTLELSVDNLLWMLALNYDGYCFTRQGKTKVFNLWSILNFFDSGSYEFDPYWYQSGGISTLLVKFIQHYARDNSGQLSWSNFDQQEQQGFWKNFTKLQVNYDLHTLDLTVLLFQAGYLTIKEVQSEECRLGLPNIEVRRSLISLFYDQIDQISSEKEAQLRFFKRNFAAVFSSSDPEQIKQLFNQAINNFSFSSNIFANESLLRDIIYNCLLYEGIYAQREEHNLLGRCDLAVFSSGVRYVFEFKLAENESQEEKLLQKAQAQILERRYGEQYPLLPTYRYAVVASKERRAVTRLELVDKLNVKLA